MIETHSVAQPANTFRRLRNRSFKLRYQPAGGGTPVVVEDESRQRGFSRADIEALVTASGCFEIDGVFGALDESIALDADKPWRMLVVLGRN